MQVASRCIQLCILCLCQWHGPLCHNLKTWKVRIMHMEGSRAQLITLGPFIFFLSQLQSNCWSNSQKILLHLAYWILKKLIYFLRIEYVLMIFLKKIRATCTSVTISKVAPLLLYIGKIKNKYRSWYCIFLLGGAI